jgi:hypothetical protein
MSDGTRVALNQQTIIHSSMEMGMLFRTKGIISVVNSIDLVSNSM